MICSSAAGRADSTPAGSMQRNPGTMIDVPRHALSSEALHGVIEEYVTRAGTDYGAQERTIEEKIADVGR